jgi:twitching motility protein PilU
VGFFPAISQQQALVQMATHLRAIISQRLVPKKGGGRVLALEILINTSRVQELIQRIDMGGLREVMLKGQNEGMQTFDACLLRQVREGLVEEQVALQYADSPNDLKLRLRGLGGSGFA